MAAASQGRAPTEDELRKFNAQINDTLAMHKFASSHAEREMLKTRSPAVYERRRALLDKYPNDPQHFVLGPEEAAALAQQRKHNHEAIGKIASAEGASAEYWGNFYQGAETTSRITRDVAVGGLLVVGTVATGGALLAGVGVAGMSAATAASLSTVGTIAFTGVTIANLSGKIAEGKQLDGGDYAEILLTVLPFGVGKAGALLKETLGAARAAKAAKLLVEAEKIAKAEKSPIGKALEKVLQRTESGREAVQDFVRASRSRVIKPQSGLGKIMNEIDVLKDAKRQARLIQSTMKQNIKDQKKLQGLANELGKLKAKNPGITGDIDPNFIKGLQKNGIKLTNDWVKADGNLMHTEQQLARTLGAARQQGGAKISAGLKAVKSGIGNIIRKPIAQGAIGTAGVLGANHLLHGGQSASTRSTIMKANHTLAETEVEPRPRPEPQAGQESGDSAPAVPPMSPEMQGRAAAAEVQLRESEHQYTVQTNAGVGKTEFDTDTNTVKLADTSKMSGYWQEVSLRFREQLVGKTPEQIQEIIANKDKHVAELRKAMYNEGILADSEKAAGAQAQNSGVDPASGNTSQAGSSGTQTYTTSQPPTVDPNTGDPTAKAYTTYSGLGYDAKGTPVTFNDQNVAAFGAARVSIDPSVGAGIPPAPPVAPQNDMANAPAGGGTANVLVPGQ